MPDTPGRTGVCHSLPADGLTVGGLRAFLERLRVPDDTPVTLDFPADHEFDDYASAQLAFHGFDYEYYGDAGELVVVVDAFFRGGPGAQTDQPG